MSVVNVASKIREHDSVNNEIKKLQARIKNLKARSSNLEDEILKYLDATNQAGLKTKDKIFKKEEKTYRLRKKKSEKDEESYRILKDSGVQNPELILTRLLEARKGIQYNTSKLKIIQNK